VAFTEQRVDLGRRRHHCEREHEPDRARHLFHLQGGKGQRRITDHVAEGDKDDARHQEDQHNPETDQDIDRTGRDAVLHQQKGDF
jgi:hypothetical protein